MKIFTNDGLRELGRASIQNLFTQRSTSTLNRKRGLVLLGSNLMAIAFCLSACNSVEQDWVSISGTVKSVQGITDQGAPATNADRVLFNRIAFQYTFENKSYENSQFVGINVPRKFEQGQTIALKVNRVRPSLAKIDLPPEPPDRTGMTLRRGLHQETLPGIGTNNE